MPLSEALGFEMWSVKGPIGTDFPTGQFLVEFQPGLISYTKYATLRASSAFKVDNAVLF